MKPERKILEVNIKEGMPYVQEAIARFNIYFKDALRMRLPVLKVVHGYGSSGKGGRIRRELHKHLENLKNSGQVKLFVPGERWDIFDPDAREVIDACGKLRSDTDLGRYNMGITIVLIEKR